MLLDPRPEATPVSLAAGLDLAQEQASHGPALRRRLLSCGVDGQGPPEEFVLGHGLQRPAGRDLQQGQPAHSRQKLAAHKARLSLSAPMAISLML